MSKILITSYLRPRAKPIYQHRTSRLPYRTNSWRSRVVASKEEGCSEGGEAQIDGQG
jgi:hypothetical protein